MQATLLRCKWCGDDPLYVAYHDNEWGVPEYNDRALFEKLMLDGFQAGLSWITILRKRENFRQAFDGFEPSLIVRYSAAKRERLMHDAGIVRNRAKIDGVVKSARAWLDIMERPGGFRDFCWREVDGRPIINQHKTHRSLPAETPHSRRLSKSLKSAGFTFCGPTIVYAFMQAVGMVNDHVVNCFRHPQLVAIS